ncbi:SCAN domain-containing protein 3-like [Prorops nasuta]|uniref:SCAN domain-containing protein 3-like n=1 Tax=Prorops nasuta TaxID=863751 RepID=UPI0034CF7590
MSLSHLVTRIQELTKMEIDSEEEVVHAVKKARIQKYRKKWESNPEFENLLKPDVSNTKAHCSICQKSIGAQLHTIQSHARSKRHLDELRNQKNTGNTRADAETETESSNLKDSVTRAELILTSFFLEHYVPYAASNHCTPMLKHCFPDSEICQNLHLGRTKLTAQTGVIASAYKKTLCKILEKSKFSILTDESTDVSTVKIACIIVIFYDDDLKCVRCALWDLIEIYRDDDSNESAEQLYTNIVNSFCNCNVSLENVIGFGSDGCNTMIGSKNSVASRFRNHYSGITILKCICHTAHLCASYACRTLPRRCEDLGRNIYNFFKLSSKRQHNLKEYKISLEVDLHKMLRASQTRWLSLEALVSRTLEQWEPLKLYFTEKWLQEHLSAAEEIFQSLHDPFIKCYYLFLQWVLAKFTKFNLLFQSDKVIIPTLYKKVSELYIDILETFMERSYVRGRNIQDVDPRNDNYFLPKNQV